MSSWETELWSQLKGSSEIALDFGWWLAIKRLMSEFKHRSFASYCWRAGKDVNFTTEKEDSIMIMVLEITRFLFPIMEFAPSFH